MLYLHSGYEWQRREAKRLARRKIRTVIEMTFVALVVFVSAYVLAGALMEARAQRQQLEAWPAGEVRP